MATSVIKSLNSNIKTVKVNVTFDNNGEWGSWNNTIGMDGYVLIYASPSQWAPTTIICDKDGFYSLKCPTKSNETVSYTLLGIKANVLD